MSEPEGYAEDAKWDLLPKEYIAKVVYYLNFGDRFEPPDEHEIEKVVKGFSVGSKFWSEPFEIEEVDLA